MSNDKKKKIKHLEKISGGFKFSLDNDGNIYPGNIDNDTLSMKVY